MTQPKSPMRLVLSPNGETEGFRREFTNRTEDMLGKRVTTAPSQGDLTFYEGTIIGAGVLSDGISVEIFVAGLTKLMHLHPITPGL